MVLALLAFAYLGVSAFFPAGRTADLFRHFVYLAAPWLAAVSSLQAARQTARPERALWWGICTGAVMTGIAIALSTPAVISQTLPPWPMLQASLMLLGPLVLAVCVVLLARYRVRSARAQLRHGTEALAAAVVIFSLVFRFVMIPLNEAYGPMPGLVLVMASLYPVIGVVLSVGAAVNHLDARANRRASWERMLASGLGLSGVALMLFPLWYMSVELAPELVWDTLVQLIAIIGMYLIHAAARVRSTCGDRARSVGGAPYVHAGRSVYSEVFPTLFVLAPPIYLWLSFSTAQGQVAETVFTACALFSAALVIVRTGLVSAENGALLKGAAADPLTGLYGNRYFHERLDIEVDLAHRRAECVAVAVIDIDDLNRLNAAYGHSRGDELIRSVAGVLEATSRPGDVVCRLGGDEFGVIFTDTDAEGALTICRRMQVVLREIAGWEDATITASFGLACFPRDGESRDEVFRKADGAQYWAKYHGKDRVIVYDDSVVQALNAEERIRTLESQSQLLTVRALAAAVDARDPLTQFHSRNVTVLTTMLARELELDDDKVTLLEVAALLHDIGKIGVSDAVLRKPGALSPEEREHVMEHPVLGERILSSTHLDEILPWVRHHHERWDGSGYPDGLTGEDIPFEARLLAICDAYDAMTTNRPYRSAMSSTAALQELDLCIGTQFDPALAEHFIRMVSSSMLLRGEHRVSVERLIGGTMFSETG